MATGGGVVRPAGCSPPEHRRQFVALEPAGILQFLAIDHDGIGQRLGVAADHDRRRKRPRLRREIFHAADSDADFFQHFAAHRFLDRFAGLGKAGETRPHGRRETRRAAEHAALAGNRQHDDDRIGAGKMLGFARRAIAPPAGLNDFGLGAAIRTVRMPRMPAEQRLGFGERRQMLRLDQALHRDRAQIGDFQIVARLERLDRLRIEPQPEPRRVIHQAEKDVFMPAAERARLGRREQRIARRRCSLQHHHFAADNIDAGARMLAEFLSAAASPRNPAARSTRLAI